MSPLLFEAILFLKYNERLWGEWLVGEGVHGAVSNCSKKRQEKMYLEVEIESYQSI